MRSKKNKNKMYWTVLITQAGHIFCCGIPLLVSGLSLLTGIGMMSAMPSGLNALHEVMHVYEVPMIMGSGLILLVGWGLHFYSERIDCLDTGCIHEPCEKKKKVVSRVLYGATMLFLINILVFFGFH